MVWLRSRAVACALASAAFVGACGGEGGTSEGDAGGPGDGATPPMDGGGDAGPTGVDAGPPPSCDQETFSTTLASGFAGDRDADPEALVALAPEGPFAFGWRSATGNMGGRVWRAEVLLADATGAEVGRVPVGEARGMTERVGQVALAPAGGGLFVAWEHAFTDADGAIDDAEVRHAGIGADATVTRAAAVLYPHAAVPVVTSDPPDDLWTFRSDIDFVDMVTGVTPQLQHLSADGTPVADAVRASPFVRVEATELHLETAGDERLVLAYRVPPSTAMIVPLDRRPVPARPERMIYDVPFVDGVAASGGAIALAWSETTGGTARVGLVVTDRDGYLRDRVDLDEFEATYQARVAVVRAWPGFVAVWRAGLGDDARLRAAGIDEAGALVAPPVDLASVPNLAGDVLAVSDGAVLTIGYRVTPPDSMPALGLTRTCAPGT